MAQNKLSNQSIQQLLAIGPLAGLDATTDPFWLDPTYARDLINFVPNHSYKGLAPIRGRIAGERSLPQAPNSGALFYAAQPWLVTFGGGAFSYRTVSPFSPWAQIAVPSLGPTINNGAGQFAQYKAWLFFANGDPKGICYKFDKGLEATFWQVAPPPKKPTEATTSPAGGMIYGDTYYYRYTYSADNATDPGLSLESSPSPPAGPFDIGTPLGPPQSNSATIAQTPAPALSPNLSGGSIPDGTYIVGTTWVSPSGESGISVTAQVTVSGGGGAATISITPSSPPAGATGWNVYTGTTANALTQQNGTRSGTGSGTELSYTTTGGPPPAYTGDLNPPATPILRTTGGGSLPARTEYYQLTYVNSNGETVASYEASIYVQAGDVVVVVSPAANANATGYNVYGSTTSAQEILQNSSPVAIGSNWTEPNSGLILGQSAVLTVVGSPDPQATSINFYRIGGQALGNWYFVGSIPNASGTQTFTDNVPDSQVTGQALVLARDTPAPFNSIFTYVDRMFGFGYPKYTDFNGVTHGARPCDLWYSNYAEPWGFDNTNQVLQVGAEDHGDVGIAGGALSGMGILWKSKTTWALYGSSPSDFFVSKLFDVGAVARNACFIALGTAFWLSQQGIYMFDGSTLTYLSRPIKAILDSMSQDDFDACVGCFDDRVAWFSFPTVGICLGYDTVDQNWWKASLYTPLFIFDAEGHARPQAPDYVFGVNPNAPTVDQWFAATTDLGLPIVSTLRTRLASSGPQIGTLRARFIELICSSNIGPADTVTLTVAANPKTTNRQFSKTFTQSAVNLRQRASVPAGIQGDEMALQLTAQTSDGLIIDGAALHGWIRRLYNTVM